MTDKTVTVPRELLREIFETADMHANHAWVLLRLRGAHTCAEDVKRSRARIAELRRLAGMEEEHE